MCMMINKEVKSELLKGPKKITAYKTLEKIAEGSYVSTYYWYIWNKGMNEAPISEDDDINSHGFHVFLDREAAVKDLCGAEKIGVLEADLDDLVAAGYRNPSEKVAIFNKLNLLRVEEK